MGFFSNFLLSRQARQEQERKAQRKRVDAVLERLHAERAANPPPDHEAEIKRLRRELTAVKAARTRAKNERDAAHEHLFRLRRELPSHSDVNRLSAEVARLKKDNERLYLSEHSAQNAREAHESVVRAHEDTRQDLYQRLQNQARKTNLLLGAVCALHRGRAIQIHCKAMVGMTAANRFADPPRLDATVASIDDLLATIDRIGNTYAVQSWQEVDPDPLDWSAVARTGAEAAH